MAVERENAVVGEQLTLRAEFIFDRTGVAFDPDSLTSVTILDSDGSTVLQTITSGDIVKDSTGNYHITTSATWNTTAKTVTDKWIFVKDGVTYTIILSTTIFESVSPSVGMASFVELVKRKVKAPTVGITVLSDPADYEEYITEALLEYSRRRPQQKTVKSQADGTIYFSLPSDWDNTFSWIDELEYPIDRASSVDNIIQSSKYQVIQLDTGWTGKFIGEYYPSNTEYFYLRYMIPHTITASSTSLPDIHKRAFVNLCASITCMAVATKYGHTADSSVEADAIDYRSKGDEFSARANEYWKMFDKVVRPLETASRGELDIHMYWPGNRNSLNKDNSII